MKTQSTNKIKLGIFVIVTTLFLVIGLYYIGSKKNIFHSTITITSFFNDVNGLMSGNNVRFNGINIGTVSKVYPVNDTTIKVEYAINENIVQYINQKSIASIGTDGLLGNKLLNIYPSKEKGLPVYEGFILSNENTISTDKTFRTLTNTSDNVNAISNNLKDITLKFNNQNSVMKLLTDTIFTQDIKSAIYQFKMTASNSSSAANDLKTMVKDIKTGKGNLGKFITDTSLFNNFENVLSKANSLSDSLIVMSSNLNSFSRKIDNNNNALLKILADTSLAKNLNESVLNAKNGTANFNENMIAVKYSWPFKKYYRRHKNVNK